MIIFSQDESLAVILERVDFFSIDLNHTVHAHVAGERLALRAFVSRFEATAFVKDLEDEIGHAGWR